jgi:alkylation response protein AidB-like acyl-CoA dehydrogenase
METSDTAEIAFDNVDSAENLMGEEEKGFPYMQHFAWKG